jgi:hypothetical protein
MDGFTLRLFRDEVELQCRFVVMAYERLQQAHDTLAEKAEANRDRWREVGRGFVQEFNVEAWFALQNLLVSAANISKLLWGSKGKKAGERQDLRDLLGVEDTSPLHSPDLRNDFEHFDERLTAYFVNESRKAYSGRNIGRRDQWDDFVVPGTKHFGHYDPTTREVTFWENAVSLPEVVAEARRILAKIEDRGG